jgi:transcriptional regulator with XRE-family HTH domain
VTIGDEYREARLHAAVTQAELSRSVGISTSEISRIEHGQAPHVTYLALVELGATLGLDLPLRAYPNGDVVRDAAQLALLGRFCPLLPSSLRHRSEVPLRIPGDRRAWDLVVDGRGWSLPVEAETRLRDVQALLRRLSLKCRDDGAEILLLVVSDTRHNRHILRLFATAFATMFPTSGRDALASLRAGSRPTGSAVILC